MNDGDVSPKIVLDGDRAKCVGCNRIIYANELYGFNGLCSQCIEDENMGEHHGG